MYNFFKRFLKTAVPKEETKAQGLVMNDQPINDRIQAEIDSQDVMLFMKGNPMFPQCGFSAATVQALSMAGVKFGSVDVLQDAEIREGIKQYSSWPTIPQLYVKGEFVGGCDIVREMFENGELQEMFKEKGIELQESAAD
mgnify:CR=1 FL=1